MADITTIGIVVENRDVITATQSLEGMTVSGTKAEASTQRLTRRMALLEIQAREMDAAQRALAAGVDYTARAMAMEQIKAQEMDAAMQKAEADSRALAEAQRLAALSAGYMSREMGLAQAEALKMDAALGKVERNSFRLTGGMGGLTSALQAVAGALVVRELIATADAYTNMQSRLRLVTTGVADLARVQAELFAVSQQTRTGLESNVLLYSSLARSTKTLGVSQSDLITMTRAVSQSFIVSGASMSETNAAVRQLGQAMASGVLRGDEFNSIAENAPRLQQAVADSLHVTIGELRQMAQDGKLTSSVLAGALLKSAEQINREFQTMPLTVGGAMQQLKNSLLIGVGAIDSAQGSSSGLASAISSIADAVEPASKTVNAFFGGIALMAADAAIAVEKAKASIAHFGGEKLIGIGAGMQRIPGLGGAGNLIASIGQSVMGSNDDTIRLMEKQRDLLAERLTKIPQLTAALTTHTAAVHTLTAEETKLLEAQEKQTFERALDAYEHFRKQELDTYKDTLDETLKLFQEEQEHETAFAITQQAEQTREAERAYKEQTDAAVKEFQRQQDYSDDMRKLWQEGAVRIAADFTKSMARGFEEVFNLAVKLMRRMEQEKKNSGAKYDAVQYGAAALGGGLAGYQTGQALYSTSHGAAGNYARGAVGGAAGGAAAGYAVGGAPGAAIGAMAGFVGGIFGVASAAKEAAKMMAEAQKQVALSMAALRAQVSGDSVAQGIASIEADRESRRKAIEEAYQGGGSGSDTVRKRNAALAEMNGLENELIAKLKRDHDTAVRQANEDVQIQILRNNGMTEQADALAKAVDQERRFADLRKQGLDEAVIAALALSEAAKDAADAANKAREYQRATEDLNVRHLRATGQGSAADDFAFRNAQRREYEDAKAAGKDPLYLALLTQTQVEEAMFRAQQIADDKQIAAIEKAGAEESARYDVQIKTAQDALAVNQQLLQAAQQQADATLKMIDTLREFSRGLSLNASLTTLSPIQQLAEARKQFDALVGKAQRGDLTAAGGLPGAASSFLTASHAVNASGAGYVADFLRTQQGVNSVTGGLNTQLTFERQMVVGLGQQNDALSRQITILQDAKAKAEEQRADMIEAIKQGVTVAAESALDNRSGQDQMRAEIVAAVRELGDAIAVRANR